MNLGVPPLLESLILTHPETMVWQGRSQPQFLGGRWTPEPCARDWRWPITRIMPERILRTWRTLEVAHLKFLESDMDDLGFYGFKSWNIMKYRDFTSQNVDLTWLNPQLYRHSSDSASRFGSIFWKRMNFFFGYTDILSKAQSYQDKFWLVVWNIHFTFPYIWGIIIPID